MATTKQKTADLLAAVQTFCEDIRDNARLDLGLRRAAEKLIASLEEVSDE